MQYRRFGKHDVNVSEIGFGAWAIGGSWGPQSNEDSVAALNTSLDLGLNFIDTAAGYGGGKSERIIGEVLAALATKFGADGILKPEEVGAVEPIGGDCPGKVQLLLQHPPLAQDSVHPGT